MKKKLIYSIFGFIVIFGCSQVEISNAKSFEIPKRNHDLSFTPFDKSIDDSSFEVCDSTSITSGRNRLQYSDGRDRLTNDIKTLYKFKENYRSYSGYIVIRFISNCKGQIGRYRLESLGNDLLPQEAPPGLIADLRNLSKSLTKWDKRGGPENNQEYSKFINLKFENGELQHVLL